MTATTCGCADHERPTPSRRRVLAAGAAGAFAALAGEQLSTRLAFAADSTYSGDVLVLLSLRGGFDGLSAVVPAGDAAYYAARPTIGVPKAGVFAEGAARVVAASLIARLRGGDQPGAYDGLGSCYVEFGAGLVGRVDVDFLSGPKPTGTFQEPSAALVAEKLHFGSSRRARWFNS